MNAEGVGTWWVTLVISTAIVSLWLHYDLSQALGFAFWFSLGWWTTEIIKDWWRNRPRPPYGGAA